MTLEQKLFATDLVIQNTTRDLQHGDCQAPEDRRYVEARAYRAIAAIWKAPLLK